MKLPSKLHNLSERTFGGPKIDTIFGSKAAKLIEGKCYKVGLVGGVICVKITDLRSGDPIGGYYSFETNDGKIVSDRGYWIRLLGTADQILTNGLPIIGERILIIYEGEFPHTGFALRTQSIRDSSLESLQIIERGFSTLISGSI